MSKLSLAICAVLLVLAVYAQRVESAPQYYAEHVEAPCVDSIELAIIKIADQYERTVELLPNPHDREIAKQILDQATGLFIEAIPRVSGINSADKTLAVQSAFGNVIDCPKNYAIWVRDVTDQVVFEFNYMVDVYQ